MGLIICKFLLDTNMEAKPEEEEDGGFSDSYVMEFDVTEDSWVARKAQSGQVGKSCCKVENIVNEVFLLRMMVCAHQM